MSKKEEKKLHIFENLFVYKKRSMKNEPYHVRYVNNMEIWIKNIEYKMPYCNIRNWKIPFPTYKKKRRRETNMILKKKLLLINPHVLSFSLFQYVSMCNHLEWCDTQGNSLKDFHCGKLVNWPILNKNEINYVLSAQEQKTRYIENKCNVNMKIRSFKLVNYSLNFMILHQWWKKILQTQKKCIHSPGVCDSNVLHTMKHVCFIFLFFLGVVKLLASVCSDSFLYKCWRGKRLHSASTSAHIYFFFYSLLSHGSLRIGFWNYWGKIVYCLVFSFVH